MKQWLISKIPTWILRYLIWRNYRLYRAGHSRNMLQYWAEVELWWREAQIRMGCKPVPRNPPLFIHKYKERIILSPEKPVGVPEWLANDSESYGYKDEPEPLDSIMYKGVPFYYPPCFCDRSIGESCEACHPDRKKHD